MALNPERVETFTRRLRREIDEGILPSCSAAIGLDGKVVWAEAFGAATPDSRYPIFSCTKALIAGVMWQLIAEGGVAVEDRVSDHFAEFAGEGKGEITIEQLLTHTGGFPNAPMGPPRWSDRQWRVQRMATWRLNWEPGTRFEYHPTSAHWVLAEIIARVDGRDHRDAVRERILEPLGMQHLRLGVPRSEQGDIEHLEARGEAPDNAEMAALLGVESFDLGEVTPELLLGFDDPDVVEVGVPGGGAVSTASELALLYQAMLHNTASLWDPEVLADGTGRIRCTMPDPMTGVAANRSLGLVIAGDDGKSAFRGMGHNVSPGTFGHNGAGGQIAWADPATGMSFCYLTNGIDRDFIREARRIVGIASRAGLLTAPI